MMDTIGYYLIGGIGGIISILYVRYISKTAKTELLNYAIGLVIAALIYVGFALWHGASDWYSIELGGLLLYGLLAYLGIWYSVWFLALGWATHVLWDVMLHMSNTVQFVPVWYPPACLIFDLILAAYIIYRFKTKTPIAS